MPNPPEKGLLTLIVTWHRELSRRRMPPPINNNPPIPASPEYLEERLNAALGLQRHVRTRHLREAQDSVSRMQAARTEMAKLLLELDEPEDPEHAREMNDELQAQGRRVYQLTREVAGYRVQLLQPERLLRQQVVRAEKKRERRRQARRAIAAARVGEPEEEEEEEELTAEGESEDEGDITAEEEEERAPRPPPVPMMVGASAGNALHPSPLPPSSPEPERRSPRFRVLIEKRVQNTVENKVTKWRRRF